MESLITEWVQYGPGGEYAGYLAFPGRAEPPLPGVLVVQEAWGVDAHIQDVTRRFALAGYAAFAPDLFVKNGERPAPLAPDRLRETLGFLNALGAGARMDPKQREAELERRDPAEGARIRETFTTLFAGGFLAPLLAAATFLRTEHSVTRGQKIASVGFCMGGGLSVLLACHDPELAGAVVFYGRAPSAEDLARIRCPVLGFYGSRDKPLVDALSGFTETMKAQGKALEIVTYAAAEHAFFNDTRPTYDVGASRDAFVRTLEFLRRVAVGGAEETRG